MKPQQDPYFTRYPQAQEILKEIPVKNGDIREATHMQQKEEYKLFKKRVFST